jgi:cyclopropane fatty-acyl-phospholipid synthase-like methyltransferase
MEIILIGALLFVCAIALYFLYQGPIYVPTLAPTVKRMIEEIEIKPGMKVADLGSGDGRIVIAFAQKGAEVVGYEINPLLVMWSRIKLKKANVHDRARIESVNFWKANLGSFDVVVVFGIGHIMNKLSSKLNSELKTNALIVSNAFTMPGFEEVRTVGSLIIYRKT